MGLAGISNLPVTKKLLKQQNKFKQKKVNNSEFELSSYRTSSPGEQKIFWQVGAQNYEQHWSCCFPKLNSMVTKGTWNWMRCGRFII